MSNYDFCDRTDELTGYEEHLDHEMGAAYGDPRRCPRHPHVQISSPDGMFDAPCGACESEMDDAQRAYDEARRQKDDGSWPDADEVERAYEEALRRDFCDVADEMALSLAKSDTTPCPPPVPEVSEDDIPF